jgi:hypothetical protein
MKRLRLMEPVSFIWLPSLLLAKLQRRNWKL